MTHSATVRHTVQVDFGIHVAEDIVGSMVTGLGAAGIVHQDPADARRFIVEVLRPAKLAYLKQELSRWEAYGFLRWEEISSSD